MTLLAQPHWNTITPSMHDVLSELSHWEGMMRFYLAGGTALALQLGHRSSVDLDFFSETDEVSPSTHSEILKHLSSPDVKVLESAWGNFVLEINEVRTGFFSYSYPLLEMTLELEKIRLASITDIGLMKLDALISRASRKDFYDLYCITQRQPFDKLLAMGVQKYPYARDFEVEAIRSLTFFENAERDTQPQLFTPIAWETIKAYFCTQAQQLAAQWLDIDL